MRLRKLLTSAVYNTFLKFGIEVKRVRGTQIHRTSAGDIFFTVGATRLTAPSDHALPQLLKQFPDYSWSLGRLARLLEQTYKSLQVIDVGANIGDSAAIIRNYCRANIACIEGNATYFKYLLRNIEGQQNTVAFQKFLGERQETISASIEENQGTIRILPKRGRIGITISTLDDFIHEHPEYQTAHLLKIDADGYDLRIIRGGKNYIRSAKPVIHFEYAKFYFEEFGENGLDTLKFLEQLGYETAVLYDNFGRFLISTDLHNAVLLKQIDGYLTNGAGAFSYVDIVTFHKQDKKIADRFVQAEEKRNGTPKK